MKRLTLHSLGSLILIALTSCGTGSGTPVGYSLRSNVSQVPGLGWVSPITPISTIDQDLQNRMIYLEGQVHQLLPLVGEGLYRLVDESGSIWVKTSETLPVEGESLTIRALIHYEPVLMANQDIGEHYAIEQERLPAD